MITITANCPVCGAEMHEVRDVVEYDHIVEFLQVLYCVSCSYKDIRNLGKFIRKN